MPTGTNNILIKKLKALESKAAMMEVQAQELKQECHITRILLEGDVSTTANNSSPVSAKVIATVTGKRRKYLKNKSRRG